ncbi:MAG TPA: FAD-dependent oxidoreductase [Streptosporangiaceae bacterium]|nr:FAD-dependent oxidoreductase [Streptosporangiaceae bacterium]
MPDRIVIVGAGIAGATAAMTLRSEGHRGDIVLIGAEPEEPYRRPAVSKALLAGLSPPELIRLKPPGFWDAQGIELRTGVAATAVDRQRRLVTLADGRGVAYDRLLLATGGRPRSAPGIPVLRTLADALDLRGRLARRRRLVIIGGGLIGLEAAAIARSLGADVTILEAANQVLGRVLPDWIAAHVAELHRSQGVHLYLGATVGEVGATADGGYYAAGPSLYWLADLVLTAIGTDPETALAGQSGLLVDDGIVVDEYLATSDPDIYAAGDAARTPSGRSQNWPDAQQQGLTAARNMLGHAVRHTGAGWCWSDQYDLTLQICGDLTAMPAVDGSLAARDATVIFWRERTPAGVVCLNRPHDFDNLRKQISADLGEARPARARLGAM